MYQLPGLFDGFDNLDAIQAEGVASWLKPQPTLSQIENHLANRILYPQAFPLTAVDMAIDLAILRETLKIYAPGRKDQNNLLGGNPFLNFTLRKILIPARLLEYVPDLKGLVWAFVDGLVLDRDRKDFYQDIWTVVLTGDLDEVVGSVILPQFEKGNGKVEITASGKKYKIPSGGLTVIPCQVERLEITYTCFKGKVLGKQNGTLHIFGGKLGLVIDGRQR